MPRTTATLATSGMHCGSCAMLIDMTLADVSGVEASQTDHTSGSTLVVFDDSVTSIDSIVEAIRSVGYEAEPTV